MSMKQKNNAQFRLSDWRLDAEQGGFTEMENGKTSVGRRVLNIILLLLNLACLIWILVSWRGEQGHRTVLDYYRDRGVDVSDFETMENDGSVRP